MKFSTNMLAGLGLIAAAGLITPAMAATTGAAQSPMPAGEFSGQSGAADEQSGAANE